MPLHTRPGNNGPDLTGADIAVSHRGHEKLLSLLLGVVIALAGTAVAKAIAPAVFGSCFEGGCGYAAMLVALLGTLVLAPRLWFALARLLKGEGRSKGQFSLVWPSGRLVSSRLRAFIDFAAVNLFQDSVATQ